MAGIKYRQALFDRRDSGRILSSDGVGARIWTEDLLMTNYSVTPPEFSLLLAIACSCLTNHPSLPRSFARCSPLFSPVWCTFTVHNPTSVFPPATPWEQSQRPGIYNWNAVEMSLSHIDRSFPGYPEHLNSTSCTGQDWNLSEDWRLQTEITDWSSTFFGWTLSTFSFRRSKLGV